MLGTGRNSTQCLPRSLNRALTEATPPKKSQYQFHDVHDAPGAVMRLSNPFNSEARAC